MVEEGGDVYFNVSGKLLEAQYNTLAGRYEAEYVFGNVGLVKVNVSCLNINISDNRGVEITVLKKDVAFESVKVSDITYGDVLRITAKVNVDGGVVSVTVDGRQYSANVNNRVAVIEIANMNVGKYDAAVTYNGGGSYTKPTEQVTFTVSKRNAEITAGDASYIINYGGVYSVTVKGAANEKLTFTLGGKDIASAVTDKNGVAKIQLTANVLKAVKAGKKNLVIKLENSNYNANVKTVKITVTKEKTKIAAKKKTFKRKVKTKKYSITLKDSKGKGIKNVQATIKVGKKTFKAKTNAKGKATFKITKLTKKGKFKATIKFKGNAYYGSSTKKATITIK